MARPDGAAVSRRRAPARSSVSPGLPIISRRQEREGGVERRFPYDGGAASPVAARAGEASAARAFASRILPVLLLFAMGPAAPPAWGAVTEQPLAAAVHDRRPRAVEIRVLDGGWGSARTQDIEAVLYSVAGILLEHFPGRRLHPILVTHDPARPMTLYDLGECGAHQTAHQPAGRLYPRRPHLVHRIGVGIGRGLCPAGRLRSGKHQSRTMLQ
jgi:hypothetical protein